MLLKQRQAKDSEIKANAVAGIYNPATERQQQQRENRAAHFSFGSVEKGKNLFTNFEIECGILPAFVFNFMIRLQSSFNIS